jgi:hypothetical protein
MQVPARGSQINIYATGVHKDDFLIPGGKKVMNLGCGRVRYIPEEMRIHVSVTPHGRLMEIVILLYTHYSCSHEISLPYVFLWAWIIRNKVFKLLYIHHLSQVKFSKYLILCAIVC